MQENVSDFWVNLIKIQLKFRYPIMLVIAVLTVFFCIKASDLKIKTEFEDFYPKKHEYIKLYKEFRKMFGSANILTLIIERTDGQNIYNPVTLRKVDELTRGILATKGCNPNQVSSIAHPSVKNIKITNWGIGVSALMSPRVPQTLEAAERFRKIVYSNEGIRGFYISLDDKAAAIHAGFWEDANLGVLYDSILGEEGLLASVQDENHKFYVAGYPILYSWVTHYRTLIWCILGINLLAKVVLLLIYFRNLRGLLLPFSSMFISIAWGLGFAKCLGYNLDVLLFVVPLLLSSRALSHSCQCMERYLQEYAACGDTNKAIVAAFSALYPPATLAIVTDGLGILCVYLATIPLIQALAVFSSFWIISIFISVVLINPIILSFLPAPKVKEADLEVQEDFSSLGKKGPYRMLIYFLYSLSGPRAKWVVLAVLLLLLFGGGYVTTSYLKVGDSSAGAAILYPDHDYNVARKKMNESFVGASRLIVVARGKEEGAIKNKETLATMEKLSIFMQRHIENVGGTLSLVDLVQRLFRMFHEGNPKWAMAPERERDLGAVFFQLSCNMVPGEMDKFVNLPQYTHSNVTAFFRNYDNAIIKNALSKVKDFKKQVEADEESKIEIELAAGLMGILAAVNEEVENSYWLILIAIFSSTYILCLIAYRSFKAAFILIMPLAAAQVLSELVMLAFHIDLNINSLPVAAIGVGLGIDYGIYLMSRLREESLGGRDFSSARYMALSTTGKVILFTAFNLSVGVSFWLMSAVKFQAEMGLLIGLLLWFNALGALVFIPALTGILKPDFVRDWKGGDVTEEVAA